MTKFRAADGQIITDEQMDAWSQALGEGEWPKGWESRGKAVHSKPRLANINIVTLPVKMPASMKKTIEHEAQKEEMDPSDYARDILKKALNEQDEKAGLAPSFTIDPKPTNEPDSTPRLLSNPNLAPSFGPAFVPTPRFDSKIGFGPGLKFNTDISIFLDK